MSLNKAQLVSSIANASGLTKVQSEKALGATLEAIKGELAKGENVTLIGFGTFTVAERKARTGKNPQTGETIKIPARKVPKFRPGKALHEIVDPKKSTKKKAASKKK
ncbi:MAG: HU family DNA-binding protein [Candidatus Kapabacteria bacterium]|nr:HU family DNA-binding protein [Candidatus Kapabacteria bacterium]